MLPEGRHRVGFSEAPDATCSACGCTFPDTNHPALLSNLYAVVAERDEARKALRSLLATFLEVTPPHLDPKDVMRFHRQSYEVLFGGR